MASKGKAIDLTHEPAVASKIGFCIQMLQWDGGYLAMNGPIFYDQDARVSRAAADAWCASANAEFQEMMAKKDALDPSRARRPLDPWRVMMCDLNPAPGVPSHATQYF